MACSLLQEFPSAKVVAIDKCPKALHIAKRNAENLNLIINFCKVIIWVYKEYIVVGIKKEEKGK